MSKISQKDKNLIAEQNKSLFMICGVIIVIIALVGLLMMARGHIGNDTNKTEDNGIVDDLGVFKKK